MPFAPEIEAAEAEDRWPNALETRFVTASVADGAPQREQGRMAASTAPGLGIHPKEDVLGEPGFQIG